MLVKFFFFFLVWSGPICFTVNPTVHLTNPALSSGTKPHSLAPWGHRPGLFLTASPLFYFFLIEFFWKIPNQVKAKAPWRPLIILFFYFILTRDMYFGVSQNRINRGKKGVIAVLFCCYPAISDNTYKSQHREFEQNCPPVICFCALMVLKLCVMSSFIFSFWMNLWMKQGTRAVF